MCAIGRHPTWSSESSWLLTDINQLWVADMTYISTWAGFLYLSVVIDVYSRKIVGWAFGERMTSELVVWALNMALMTRKPESVIHHSGQGSQLGFKEVLKKYGITNSMSRRGNCWDNACSETLFGSLKVERLHGQRFVTRCQAKDEAIAWLLWYNKARLHST